MKKQLFINHVKSNGVIILSVNDQPQINENVLQEFRMIKGFFKHIDFDCQINSTGGCKETPDALSCCCDDCYRCSGHFRRLVDIDITMYARRFSIKTGFWRKGKGCVLPHEMRSVTCVTHHCNNSRKSTFTPGMIVLKHKLQDLRLLI